MSLFLFLCFFVHYVPGLLASPIIGGATDVHHLFTSHVSFHVIKERNNKQRYICGGTIIHERYILTAALEFVKHDGTPNDYKTRGESIIVIAGTNKRDGPGIQRSVLRILTSTDFAVLKFTDSAGHSSYVIHANIAVAQLNANLGVAEHPNEMQIAPRLPLSPNERPLMLSRFCGFGADTLERQSDGQLQKRSYSDINKFLNVKMLPRAECLWHDEFICTKSLESSGIHTACLGDVGSGLMYGGYVIGILSVISRDCNTNDIPILFTRIWQHSKWIERALDWSGSREGMQVLQLPQPRVGESSRTSRAHNPHT